MNKPDVRRFDILIPASASLVAGAISGVVWSVVHLATSTASGDTIGIGSYLLALASGLGIMTTLGIIAAVIVAILLLGLSGVQQRVLKVGIVAVVVWFGVVLIGFWFRSIWKPEEGGWEVPVLLAASASALTFLIWAASAYWQRAVGRSSRS